MSHTFTRAIVRPPSATFTQGITSHSALGAPDLALAAQQHAAYCEALVNCGLTLSTLPPDDAYPDSTFVEDTAVIARGCAVLTRPGAASRAGEIVSMKRALAEFFPSLHEIVTPGTVDGGDICEAEDEVFIGISERTNAEGARQLIALLATVGIPARTIDIRKIPGLLHLKSGLTSLGNTALVAAPEIAERPEFAGYKVVPIIPGEEYAANCVRVNDRVLIATGFPYLLANLQWMGFDPIELDMWEFEKMDGGLSCLSLRF
ncbi:MAG: N(G),N(G)-dimethylarginine dimethylaminohydrolase [bacterium]